MELGPAIEFVYHLCPQKVPLFCVERDLIHLPARLLMSFTFALHLFFHIIFCKVKEIKLVVISYYQSTFVTDSNISVEKLVSNK